MFLSPCLLAAALFQEAPSKLESELPKAFANLDTMRRMLVRKVGEKSAEIGPKPPDAKPTELPIDTDGDGITDMFATNPNNNVTNDYLRATRNAQVEASVSSLCEYVPGLAAVFSLTVPVRTQSTQLKVGAAPEGAAPRNEDDADWEEIAKGIESRSWRTYQEMLKVGGAAAVAQTYSPEALAALRKTVIDTMWRFGHKLELGRGERLAVVITVTPAAGSLDAWQHSPKGTATTYQGVLQAMGRAGMSGDGAAYMTQSPASQRLVFQISADDLNAYKSGDLEQDELAKKTRVQSFVMPAEESRPLNSYGANWAR